METLTEAEAALYDRQIRLWGLEAQRRLRASRILIIGISHAAQEIAKNIILAGVSSVELVDDAVVTEYDVGHSFVFEEAHLNLNRATACVNYLQNLNPMVKITSIDLSSTNTTVHDWIASELIATSYDVILYSPDHWKGDSHAALDKDLLSRKVREVLPAEQPKLVALYMFGKHFFALLDLSPEFQWMKPKRLPECVDGSGEDSSANNEAVNEPQTVEFCPISEVLADANAGKIPRHMRKFFLLDQALLQFISTFGALPNATHQPILQEYIFTLLSAHPGWNAPTDEDILLCCCNTFAPVNAVAGGIIAQEIIKAISRNDCPYGNYLFFDAKRHDACGHMFTPSK